VIDTCPELAAAPGDLCSDPLVAGYCCQSCFACAEDCGVCGYSLAPVDDASSFDDWTLWSDNGGSGVFRADLGGVMELSNSASGGITRLYAEVPRSEGQTDFSIAATLLASNLDEADQCRFDVSTDGGTTWVNVLTLLDGDGNSARFSGAAVIAGSGSHAVIMAVTLDSGDGSSSCSLADVVVECGFCPCVDTLYELGPVSSSSDLTGWTFVTFCDGVLSVDGPAWAAEIHNGPGSGGCESYLYAKVAPGADEDAHALLTVGLAAEGLEEGDSCRFEASVDNGATWTSVATLVDGDDGLQTAAGKFTVADCNLYVRLKLRSEEDDESCLLSNVTVCIVAEPETTTAAATTTIRRQLGDRGSDTQHEGQPLMSERAEQHGPEPQQALQQPRPTAQAQRSPSSSLETTVMVAVAAVGVLLLLAIAVVQRRRQAAVAVRDAAEECAAKLSVEGRA
jgi:hypothetical protein